MGARRAESQTVPVEWVHWALAAAAAAACSFSVTPDKEIHLHVGAIPNVAQPGR
jgi:hypothetical protein